jgi:hypothetical protein
MSTTQDLDKFLYDRDGLSKLAAELYGVRIPKSRFDKLALIDLGPPVDARLGNRQFTSRRNAIAYLESILSWPAGRTMQGELERAGRVKPRHHRSAASPST